MKSQRAAKAPRMDELIGSAHHYQFNFARSILAFLMTMAEFRCTSKVRHEPQVSGLHTTCVRSRADDLG